jgi:hypothetical protein
VPASGDGLSAKDKADTADDIKMLVFGSKLVGYTGGQFGAPRPELLQHNGSAATLRALRPSAIAGVGAECGPDTNQ